MATRKRCAIVGVGGRSAMYLRATADSHKEHAELVALCDRNPGRLALAQADARELGVDVPTYSDTDFDRMIEETRPDTVIVTTMDRHHDEYICRAMEKGCDAVTEKPMTTDATKCQRIVDTVNKTGRQVRVTFNYRYSPFRSQVKELLQEGVIGRILSVEFKWLLDTSHGADYFRRWHRNKENSGGLLVHKATHHFDLVNWWINSVPKRVSAIGARRFYTPEQAERYGFHNRAERCQECPEADRCPFFMDLAAVPRHKAMYLDCEEHDGYFRDRCVFSDTIDIEDSMSVSVEYRSGVVLSYALNAYSPWEGYQVVFNGTKGRLEHLCRETSYISGDGTVPGELVSRGTTINVMPHFTSGYFVPVRTGSGGHGGGDVVLLTDLFSDKAPEDPLKRAADHRAGAYSILTGVAGNTSIAENRIVDVDELVSGLDEPDYPDESAWDVPIVAPAFIRRYEVAPLDTETANLNGAAPLREDAETESWNTNGRGLLNLSPVVDGVEKGTIRLRASYAADTEGDYTLFYGCDAPSRIWINGEEVADFGDLEPPVGADMRKADVRLQSGKNEIAFAVRWSGEGVPGIYTRFAPVK